MAQRQVLERGSSASRSVCAEYRAVWLRLLPKLNSSVRTRLLALSPYVNPLGGPYQALYLDFEAVTCAKFFNFEGIVER